MEHIQFATSDEVVIHADWRSAEGTKVALLLHMMPATKESWGDFADALLAHGISSLAIDFRGHGESCVAADGKTLDHNTFSDAEQQAKRFDVETALAWLKEKGFEEKNLVLIGASIGANLAIRALAEHADVPSVVALSPGVDFHGVMTNDAIVKLAPHQRVLLCASEDDPGSFMSVNDLHDQNRTQTFRVVAENLGHGTDMFLRDPKFLAEVVEWVSHQVAS